MQHTVCVCRWKIVLAKEGGPGKSRRAKKIDWAILFQYFFSLKKKKKQLRFLNSEKKKMYHNRSRNYLVYWPVCTQRYNHRSWARISFGCGPGATTFHFSSANSFFCCCCVSAYSLVTYLFIYLGVELSVLCDNHIVVCLSSPNPTLKNRKKKKNKTKKKRT